MKANVKEIGSLWLHIILNKFIVGAFAKQGIFTRSNFQDICTGTNPTDIKIKDSTPGYFENDVYWYAFHCFEKFGYTYGLSSVTPIHLNFSGTQKPLSYVNCPSPTNVDSTSWGNSGGCAGTRFDATNTEFTNRFYRVIYTNTCDILVPPY